MHILAVITPIVGSRRNSLTPLVWFIHFWFLFLYSSLSLALSLSFSLFPSREHDHRGGMKRRTRQQQRRDKKRAFLSAATSGIQADTERRKKRTTARAAATITLPRFPFFVTQRDRAFWLYIQAGRDCQSTSGKPLDFFRRPATSAYKNPRAKRVFSFD